MSATFSYRAIERRHIIPQTFAAAWLSVLTLPAAAQIYKCVAPSGHVTYQQAPCAQGTPGGRADLVIDNGSSRAGSDQEQAWEDAVKTKTVVVGMPRGYVLRALGAAPAIRAGGASDNATEVWSYPQGTDTRRIGMTGGVVVWERIDSPDAVPAAMTRTIQLRNSVTPGVKCAQVIADLGPPDADVVENNDLEHRKYTWAATAEDPKGTMFVTCFRGQVIEANRSVQQ